MNRKVHIWKDFYYKRVTSREDLQTYRRLYFEQSKNDVSIAFLKKAVVIMFYYKDEPVAGFVLNAQNCQDLRYFSYADERIMAESLQLMQVKQEKCIEITSNFKLKLPRACECWFYVIMALEVAKWSNHWQTKFVVGGSGVTKIKQKHLLFLPHMLYHGYIKDDLASTIGLERPVLMIYTATVREYLVNTLKFALEFVTEYFKEVVSEQANQLKLRLTRMTNSLDH